MIPNTVRGVVQTPYEGNDAGQYQTEIDQAQAVPDQLQLEADQIEIWAILADREDDQIRMEADQAQMETDEAQAEINQVQMETDQTRMESDQVQMWADQAEKETDQMEMETNQAQTETNQAQMDADQSETETDQMQMETDQVKKGTDQAQMEADHGETENDQVQTEANSMQTEAAFQAPTMDTNAALNAEAGTDANTNQQADESDNWRVNVEFDTLDFTMNHNGEEVYFISFPYGNIPRNVGGDVTDDMDFHTHDDGSVELRLTRTERFRFSIFVSFRFASEDPNGARIRSGYTVIRGVKTSVANFTIREGFLRGRGEVSLKAEFFVFEFLIAGPVRHVSTIQLFGIRQYSGTVRNNTMP